MKTSGKKNSKKNEIHSNDRDYRKIREAILDKVNYPAGFKTLKEFARITDKSDSTFSRWFKKMGVEKDDNGLYQLRPETALDERRKKLIQLFSDLNVKTLIDKQIIPLKTEKGAAPLAAQKIRECYHDEVLGVIAGEDTLLLVVNRDSELETELGELAKRKPSKDK